MDTDIDPRDAHQDGEREIPCSPFSIREPDNGREREKPRHVTRREGRSALTDHRRKTKQDKGARRGVKKSNAFRKDPSGEDDGERSFGEQVEPATRARLTENENEKSKNKEVWQIFREENPRNIGENRMSAEAVDEVKNSKI